MSLHFKNHALGKVWILAAVPALFIHAEIFSMKEKTSEHPLRISAHRVFWAQITAVFSLILVFMEILSVSFDAAEFFHVDLKTDSASKTDMAAMTQISLNQMGLIHGVKPQQAASIIMESFLRDQG